MYVVKNVKSQIKPFTQAHHSDQSHICPSGNHVILSRPPLQRIKTADRPATPRQLAPSPAAPFPRQGFQGRTATATEDVREGRRTSAAEESPAFAGGFRRPARMGTAASGPDGTRAGRTSAALRRPAGWAARRTARCRATPDARAERTRRGRRWSCAVSAAGWIAGSGEWWWTFGRVHSADKVVWHIAKQ